MNTEQELLDIEQLWRRFNTFKMYDEMLIEDFTNFQGDTIFPKGTYRSEIWDYFNRIYPNGVNGLLKL